MALGTVSLRCLLNCSYISQHETNDNNVTNKDHKFIVYIGSMPLRAPPGIGQWAISSADNLLLHSTNLRHFYTILASSSGSINPVKVYRGLFYSLIIIQQASNLYGDDALNLIFLFCFFYSLFLLVLFAVCSI